MGQLCKLVLFVMVLMAVLHNSSGGKKLLWSKNTPSKKPSDKPSQGTKTQLNYPRKPSYPGAGIKPGNPRQQYPGRGSSSPGAGSYPAGGSNPSAGGNPNQYPGRGGSNPGGYPNQNPGAGAYPAGGSYPSAGGNPNQNPGRGGSNPAVYPNQNPGAGAYPAGGSYPLAGGNPNQYPGRGGSNPAGYPNQNPGAGSYPAGGSNPSAGGNPNQYPGRGGSNPGGYPNQNPGAGSYPAGGTYPSAGGNPNQYPGRGGSNPGGYPIQNPGAGSYLAGGSNPSTGGNPNQYPGRGGSNPGGYPNQNPGAGSYPAGGSYPSAGGNPNQYPGRGGSNPGGYPNQNPGAVSYPAGGSYPSAGGNPNQYPGRGGSNKGGYPNQNPAGGGYSNQYPGRSGYSPGGHPAGGSYPVRTAGQPVGYPGGHPSIGGVYPNWNPNNKILNPRYGGSFGGGRFDNGGSPFSNTAKSMGYGPSLKSKGFAKKAILATGVGAMAGMAVGYGIGNFPRPNFKFKSPHEERQYNHYMYERQGIHSKGRNNQVGTNYTSKQPPQSYEQSMNTCMKRNDLLKEQDTTSADHKNIQRDEPLTDYAAINIDYLEKGGLEKNDTTSPTTVNNYPKAAVIRENDDDTVSIIQIGYPALIEQMKARKCVELYLDYSESLMERQKDKKDTNERKVSSPSNNHNGHCVSEVLLILTTFFMLFSST
ncbi:prion protein b [Carassius carassius]|uniref:prion protein b n=1 Tax=Carassius carassius TaxID=217509 RepID=UPI0028690441|nr:prion protein b [Carassius carassius]